MERPRAVVVVVVVPLLLLVIDFATCAASFPGSMDDEVPAAVKKAAGPPLVDRVAHAARMRCLHMPFASSQVRNCSPNT